MATIRITNLRTRTIIGAHEWERNIQQDVIVNIELIYDASKAIESDKLEDTIDYKELKLTLLEMIESSRFQLIETLAANILEITLTFPLVQKSIVRVDKPGALRYADSVSVELSRTKKDE